MTPSILYLIFNRPDLMEQSFAPIRSARPTQLFIAADGPRPDRVGEAERCEESRRIVEQVDWPCEVKTLFRQENLGCRKAVSEAITWFFEHVEEGIILEDDCVADACFFPFCSELLGRYRDDERIMAISGDNFQPDGFDCGTSYYFSKYPHCWGWATWRRAWMKHDDAMSKWPSNRKSSRFKKLFHDNKEFQYWTQIFDRTYAGQGDSWAYRWTLSCWLNHGLTILPCVNLVDNIGWGGDTTHTRCERPGFIRLVQRIQRPLVPPMKIAVYEKADKFTDWCVFSGERHSWFRRIISIVRSSITQLKSEKRKMVSKLRYYFRVLCAPEGVHQWMLAKKINEALYSFGDNYFEISVDYGCGHRPYLDAIERISRESIGVDVDENDIADIRIEPEKPIPLKSGAVDLVTSFQVLEHVKNYQFYLAECSRICKKGGTFVLSAPSIWPYHPHPQDMRRWMIDGLVYDVRASGFEVDRVYAVLNPIATSLQYFLSVFYYEMLRHGDLGRVLYKIAALIVNPNIIVCEYMFRKTERFGSGNYLIVAHRC